MPHSTNKIVLISALTYISKSHYISTCNFYFLIASGFVLPRRFRPITAVARDGRRRGRRRRRQQRGHERGRPHGRRHSRSSGRDQARDSEGVEDQGGSGELAASHVRQEVTGPCQPHVEEG